MLLLKSLPILWHRRLYRIAHCVRSWIWRVWKPTVQGVRVLAVDQQGRVLLVRHSYGSDKWMPAGGGVRKGEDPIEAGARELAEETGCRLHLARLLGVTHEDLHGASNVVHIVGGEAQGEIIIDGREIIEAQFFALDALPSHMPAGLLQGIRQWLAGGI